MEDREKTHIESNMRRLLDLIRQSAGLIAEIEQTGVLDSFEKAHLDSIPSDYEKTKELLKILERKVNGYSILLNAVINAKQSGAESILRQLPQQLTQQQQLSIPQTNTTANSDNMTHSKYQLVFKKEMNMGQILQSLKYGLVRCLPNKNSNLSVIMQLDALLLFDSDEIEPIIHGQYQTEQQRMTALFEVIFRIGDDGILQCLEKLCNLDNLNVASKNIRATIQNVYPDSVRPRN